MASATRTSSRSSLDGLIADHQAAAGEFIARARAVPAEEWNTPRAPGKWSPAQETHHLILGYGTFVRDLREGVGFKLKGKWWQRRIWRWFALPRILAAGRLVRGVPAPRESRPAERPGEQHDLIRELEAAVAAFHEALAHAYAADPRRRVSHPYFSVITLIELARFSAVHVRHHTAFLPEP